MADLFLPLVGLPKKERDAAFTRLQIEWIKAVHKDERLSHLDAHVALTIAFHINVDTLEAFPGQKRIASISQIKERAVRTATKKLIEIGYLSKRGGHGLSSDRYRLELPHGPALSTGTVKPLEDDLNRHDETALEDTKAAPPDRPYRHRGAALTGTVVPPNTLREHSKRALSPSETTSPQSLCESEPTGSPVDQSEAEPSRLPAPSQPTSGDQVEMDLPSDRGPARSKASGAAKREATSKPQKADDTKLSKVELAERDSDFVAWVAVYPDNQNTPARNNWKGWAKSYTAFKAATERDGSERVMSGTAAYARKQQGSDIGFNPTNFLNDGRYLDALAHEQRRASQPSQQRVNGGGKPDPVASLNAEAELIRRQCAERAAGADPAIPF